MKPLTHSKYTVLNRNFVFDLCDIFPECLRFLNVLTCVLRVILLVCYTGNKNPCVVYEWLQWKWLCCNRVTDSSTIM